MARQYLDLAQVYGAVDQSRANQMQMKNAQLQQQRYEMEMQQAQRQQQEQDGIRDVFRNATTLDANGNPVMDEKKMIAGLYGIAPEKAIEYQGQLTKRQQEAEKIARENQLGDLDMKVKKATYARDRLATITPETYTSVLTELSDVAPALVQSAPAQFDPNWVRSQIMTGDKFIEANKVKAPTTRTVRIGNDTVTQEFDERTGKFVEVGRGSAFAPTNPDAGQPVAVIGDDGKPVYVPKGQAIGKRPYSATQDAKEAARVGQQTQAELSAQQAIDQAEALFKHPGRGAGTGFTSFTSKIPGTDAKGFQANLDTFKAQTFLPMVSALKGMGALSDAEGKKIADSVGALDPSMPEEEFAKSLQTTTKFLFDKAKAAGLNVVLPEFAKPKLKLGTVEDGYIYKGGDPSDPKSWKKK